ncbi:CHASE2 domain-containing protein, partial [bacterium]|nr:CHASE2 domain-containing protein [bacterium]
MTEQYRKILTYIIYALIVVLIFVSMLWLGQFRAFERFINKIENATFDFRQSIISQYKKADKDIVIVAVDTETYEYVMDKYGSWPISRKIWADTVSAMESVEPCYIIFDLLFLKPNLNDLESDKALIEVVRDNPNIYLSMNFDNVGEEIRKSPFIPSQYRLKIHEGKLSDNDYNTYKNARMTMDGLTYVTKNIASINVTRDEDGIIRELSPV